MKNKICFFAGHSSILNKDEVGDKVAEKAEELILSENVSEFRVGNYGDFDGICAAAIRKIKQKFPHITLTLVIPYLTKEINEYKEMYYKNYDSILIADIPENTPKKLHIIKCNQFMAQEADFLVCYIAHGWGGAVKTLEYAKKKKHIKIINIAEK